MDGIAITGPDAANYTFNTTTTTTADISPATLTISATADNKVYDGSRTATAHLTDDRIGDDQLSEGDASARFDNKNAGNGKTVTVDGLDIVGPDAANYTFNTTTTTTADISPATLTISATADSKVYDGSRSATAHLTDDRIGDD